MTDNDVSFFMQQQQPIMAPIKSDKIVRNNNPIFYQANKNSIVNKTTSSKSMNVLAYNKVSTKLQVSEQFLDLISADSNNSDVAIVSFVGSKKVGKSFLVDCLISNQEKSVNRQMTRNAKPIINMPTRQLTGRSGQKVLLFDCDSSINHQNFMWTYFLSSVMVLNLNPLDRSGQQQFIKNLSFIQSHLDSDADDLTLPKLIILRRDAESNQFKEKQFLRRVQDYNLFQHDIVTLNVNYPGSVTVKSKQILDVPQSALNKNYLSDVINIYNLIKNSAKAKHIRGNVLGTKILALAIDPLTRNINKEKKANTIKIWDDVIQTLSVGYYNYYILKYSEQLQKQFEDQKPCDKYTLYKKLTSVKRRIDKKVQGFNTISGDPIFQKYRQKLNQKIISKEKMLKQINKQKSKKQNDKYCKMLFRQMDDTNCARLIDQYCKSSLDDEKTQVLLQNFQAIINQRIKDMQKSKDPSKKPSKQIQQLQEQLKKVQAEIQEQKKVDVAVAAYDFQKLQSTINGKQKQLSKLQKQLDEQKQISNKKKTNQNKDIIALQKSIQELKQKTANQEKQIQSLRQQREKKVQQMTKQLNQKLRQQDQKLAKLQEEVKKVKQASNLNVRGAQQGTKNNSCCQVM